MMRRVLSLLLLAVFLGWAAWFVATHREEFLPITQVGLLDLAQLALAFLVIVACNGYFVGVVTNAFDIRLGTREALSLSAAGSFTNFFLPFRGGAGLRALYLSRVHRFPLTGFVSTLGVMYLMYIVVNGAIAVLGMATSVTGRGLEHVPLTAFFLLLMLAGTSLLVIRFPSVGAAGRFPLKQIDALLAAVRQMRSRPRLMLKLWLLVIVLTAASVWQCAVAFDAVSVPLSRGGLLVYAASKNLATLISLTPGALGIVELISVFLGRVLDYGTADALLVQGLLRAVTIGMLLAVGPASFWYLKRRLGAAGGAGVADRRS